MSERRHSLRAALVAVPAAWLLRGLCTTWRIRYEGTNPLREQPGRVQLGAFWHRDALIAAALFRDRGFSVPVSQSRDGDRIACLLLRLGYTSPPRGSSSRSATALVRRMTRLLEAGVTISVPTDGPRGPARRSKPGVVAVARLSGVPITPLSFSARPCLRFGSWDGMRLPLPFAEVRCRFGAPLSIAAEIDGEGEERALRELDRRLDLGDDAQVDGSQAPSGDRVRREG